MPKSISKSLSVSCCIVHCGFHVRNRLTWTITNITTGAILITWWKLYLEGPVTKMVQHQNLLGTPINGHFEFQLGLLISQLDVCKVQLHVSTHSSYQRCYQWYPERLGLHCRMDQFYAPVATKVVCSWGVEMVSGTNKPYYLWVIVWSLESFGCGL